jgi:hypothetical protein
MALDYTINGVTASIAPFSQRWRQIEVGRDHLQRAIYSGNEEIDLDFGPCSITMARQWLDAASAGSANITVLNRYGIGWTDLSGVNLQVVTYPAVQAGNAADFNLVIKGASAA